MAIQGNFLLINIINDIVINDVINDTGRSVRAIIWTSVVNHLIE